jgi:hypothetical protein
MVPRTDLPPWSSSSATLPSHAHGRVAPVPSSEGICLGVPKVPSVELSFRRPLVCPSVWQEWQLYQPSSERRASWKSISPTCSSAGSTRPPSGIVRRTVRAERSMTETESSNVLAT